MEAVTMTYVCGRCDRVIDDGEPHTDPETNEDLHADCCPLCNDFGCSIRVPHCQACAGIIGEDCGEWEGYTTCCNERVVHADHDCQNTHEPRSTCT